MKHNRTWENKPAILRLAVAAQSSPTAQRAPAFRVLDALQRIPADQQISAVFLTGVILANAIGMDPHDLVTRAKRMMPDVLGRESAASAISDYAKGELGR